MSSAAPPQSALALAEQAYDSVQIRPRRAEALAEQALALARAERDTEAEVAALHALSWAQHVRGDPRTVATAKAGIRLAERYGDRRRAALLRRRLALSLANAGKIRAAEREIDVAIRELTGRDRARSEVFRMAIHRNAYGAGSVRDREIVAASRRALRLLKGSDDAIWRARLLYNRGVFYWERGDDGAATRDFRRAFELYRDLGADAARIDAAAALAGVALLRGDVVGCLEQVAQVRVTLPSGHVCFALDEAEAAALAQARLIPEAEQAIRRHLELCIGAGRAVFASSALLDMAVMALAAGRTDATLEIARRLTRVYAGRRSPIGVARVAAVSMRAQLMAGAARPSSLQRGLRAATALQTAGWRREELRLRLLLVRVAVSVGSAVQARRQLDLAEALLSRGSASDRIELHHARALVACAYGRRPAAVRSLRAGLRLLEDYRAAFGAVELRVTASGVGVELSELGLRFALEEGVPSSVLEWAEQLRGNALRLPPVRPPRDHRLRAGLVDLRHTAAQIHEAERAGRSTRTLTARQAELEAMVRTITRQTRGRDEERQQVPVVGTLTKTLGDRALVEFVEVDGVLRALTVRHGRTALHELDAWTVPAQLDWLRFALGQIARGGASSAQRAAARSSADEAAAALDRALLEPLLPSIDDASLVIVPTGALHAVPWGALPSLRRRPTVVAPSCSIWLDLARRRRSQRDRIALVAGPDLPNASREIRLLHELYPNGTVLSGGTATTASALQAFDGARLAHVACHGRFRADSPLFSALQLADGTLTAYDLQRLRRAPHVLVLSACDLALSDRRPGDELLGVAALLLSMGTRTIVASVVPVPDATTRRLMLAFHRELVAGASPATALAHAQATLRGDSAAAAGFVCLGSG
jgi:hypothetical protein